MDAQYIGKRLLSLPDNPEVIIGRETKHGRRYDTLNFSCGRAPEGFVELIFECWVRPEMLEGKEYIDPWKGENTLIDFKKVLNAVLENKKMLPALMGVDENFDKLIEEKLREKK